MTEIQFDRERVAARLELVPQPLWKQLRGWMADMSPMDHWGWAEWQDFEERLITIEPAAEKPDGETAVSVIAHLKDTITEKNWAHYQKELVDRAQRWRCLPGDEGKWTTGRQQMWRSLVRDFLAEVEAGPRVEELPPAPKATQPQPEAPPTPISEPPATTEGETPNLAKMKIPQLKEWVGTSRERAEAVRESEFGRDKPRKGVVSFLADEFGLEEPGLDEQLPAVEVPDEPDNVVQLKPEPDAMVADDWRIVTVIGPAGHELTQLVEAEIVDSWFE